MKVFVAGATGVVGRRAVGLLVAAGHEVTGIARSDHKARLLADLGASAARVDLFDHAEVAAAVAGHEVVINLATHIPSVSEAARPGAWAENDRIRTDGSRVLVDAAIAAGAARYIQESVAFSYPDRGDEWIDESVTVEPSATVASGLAAEQAAARFAEAGNGQAVVLRFAFFYGPGASHTASSVRAARKGIGVSMGSPSGYISSIHLDDAASAVVAAMAVPSGIYNVGDDEPLTRREYADALGAAVGRRRVLALPGRAAKLGGGRAAALTRSQRVSNRRLRDASGWAPVYPSARDGWPAVIAAMDDEEQIDA